MLTVGEFINISHILKVKTLSKYLNTLYKVGLDMCRGKMKRSGDDSEERAGDSEERVGDS